MFKICIIELRITHVWLCIYICHCLHLLDMRVCICNIHVHGSNCILYKLYVVKQTMLQSLCDIELSLHDDLESVEIQTQLANELPDADTLQTIMSAFMSHIGDYDHCYASILQSLRTLDMFIDYSYTFNFLKR